MPSKNRSDITTEAQKLSLPPAPGMWSAPDEWLETNGLGGWAGSTITGCNTRRYHSLLMAATVPPADRMNLLSKLDETIIVNGQRFELSVNNYGNTITPQGYHYLFSFARVFFPEWLYKVDDIILKKTIAMVHGENTTLIIYEVNKAARPFTLELLPLISARGYHSLQHANSNIFWNVHFENGIFKNQPYCGVPYIYISIPGATYKHDPVWFYRFTYPAEQYRGLDFEEDLFSHGTFTVELEEGDRLGVIVSTEDPTAKTAGALLEKESMRRKGLVNNCTGNETLQQLILAADQFIVKRNVQVSLAAGNYHEGVSVIAGYHWFTDWSRDTMIALPGLCLSTGRYEDARKIIDVFARNVSMGMLPNRFMDGGKEPEYNNVDGTLWYFIAVYKYLTASGDEQFILNKILPVLEDIIDWHYKGTRYNIHVDKDGLLYAGEPGQQLTWMDAKVGAWVVTPRIGKAVEIQALWYNALKIFSELLKMNGQQNEASLADTNAEEARKNFTEKFWYKHRDYLYDVINENGEPVVELRPNQLFAISLPFALLDDVQARLVLKNVAEQLYTPVGLKSLSGNDIRYMPVYGGDIYQRDAAYHQGTVWSWLLGPYIDAIMRLYPDTGRQWAKKIIHDFRFHLNEAGIGTVSEIFDAEAPHHPRGCIAQAWGVAEILRVTKDYELLQD